MHASNATDSPQQVASLTFTTVVCVAKQQQPLFLPISFEVAGFGEDEVILRHGFAIF